MLPQNVPRLSSVCLLQPLLMASSAELVTGCSSELSTPSSWFPMTVDERDLVPWLFFLSEVRANDRKLRLRVLDSGRNILATTFSAYVEKKALVI